MSGACRLALEAGSYRTALEQLHMAITLNPTNSWLLNLEA